jgi:hypothetical protein
MKESSELLSKVVRVVALRERNSACHEHMVGSVTPLICPAHVDATSKLQLFQPSNRILRLPLAQALQCATSAEISKVEFTYLYVSID